MSAAPESVRLRTALAELDRLREEVVRLQAKVDALETAAAASADDQQRRGRGLASLIPSGASKVG